MVLGITGGFGCGKSTAAKLFAERGFRHLDADQVIREHVLTAPEVTGALRQRLGDQVFLPDGSVNRPALGGIVFRDDAERFWLEGLTHPPLFARLRAMLPAEPLARWIVEMPLLFEKSLENWFDFTLCVGCDPLSQLARLEQRGLDRALAELRISKQLPLARKIERSDLVLWNDGSTGFLKSQVDRIVDALDQDKAGTPLTENPNGTASQDRRRYLRP